MTFVKCPAFLSVKRHIIFYKYFVPKGTKFLRNMSNNYCFIAIFLLPIINLNV